LRLACRRPLRVGGVLLGGERPLVCVPMVASDEVGAERFVDAVLEFRPDLVELRVDYWDFVEDLDRSLGLLERIRERLSGVPLLLTCRDSAEGGARFVPLERRRELYFRAIENAFVDMVDVELARGYGYIEQIKTMTSDKGIALVVSWHDFSGTPSGDFILSVISRQIFCGADVAKVAVMAKGEGDLEELLLATRRARLLFPEIPLITMAMGEKGVLSRLVGFAFGSDLTFAALSGASAPGQVSAALLRTLFESFEKLGLWGAGSGRRG